MDSNMVRFRVDLAINEGAFEVFESIVQTMNAGSQKESGTIGYDWFLSSDRKKCRLLETYLNADAALAHCTGPVVTELVAKTDDGLEHHLLVFVARAIAPVTRTSATRPTMIHRHAPTLQKRAIRRA